MKSTLALAIVASALVAASLPARADIVSATDATDPLAFFPLQSANGGSTVNGYTSTEQNGATIGSVTGGPQANGLLLTGDNTTQPYEATSLSGSINGAGSIMAWVNLSSLNGGAVQYIAGESQVGNDFDFQFTADDSTHENLCFYTDAGSSTCAVIATSSLLGTWDMVTATYNSTTGEQDVYFGGTLVATNDNGTAGQKNDEFTIGYSTVFGGRDFDGDISDVAVWDTQIGADTVAALYAAGTAPTPTGVPEPGSLALLGSALAGLAAVRRRRS